MLKIMTGILLHNYWMDDVELVSRALSIGASIYLYDGSPTLSNKRYFD